MNWKISCVIDFPILHGSVQLGDWFLDDCELLRASTYELGFTITGKPQRADDGYRAVGGAREKDVQSQSQISNPPGRITFLPLSRYPFRELESLTMLKKTRKFRRAHRNGFHKETRSDLTVTVSPHDISGVLTSLCFPGPTREEDPLAAITRHMPSSRCAAVACVTGKHVQ